MARTTYAAVTAIIDTETDIDVNVFISDASLWVTQNLGSAGLSADVLEAIERYLAAHLITLRDPRLRSAKVGDVQESYQRDSETTEYLKAAAALDPTGAVEDRFMGKRPKMMFRVGAGYDDDLTDLPTQTS